MSVSLGNPYGLLGLLAVPALIAIYSLRSRSTRLVVAGLFLWQLARHDPREAQRLERFQHSVPFWLQLLATLCITALLSEPQITVSPGTATVTIGLDGSLSMAAFASKLTSTVPAALDRIIPPGAAVDRIEILVDGSLGQPLYSGPDRNAAVDALERFQPTGAPHGSAELLRLLARRAEGGETALFVSDSRVAVPSEVSAIGIGSPIENTGFLGLHLSRSGGVSVFRALVKNHGSRPVTRDFWIEAGEERTAPQPITLSPGQVREIKGTLPAVTESCVLRISSDDFTLDDVLPIVKPQPRALHAYVERLPAAFGAVSALLERFERVAQSPDTSGADLLVLFTAERERELQSSLPVLFFTQARGQELPAPRGPVVTHRHRLTASLTFTGLVVPHVAPYRGSGEALLSAGSQPLVVFERDGRRTTLRFLFNPHQSNITRLPAFPLILARYFDLVREDLRRELRVNLPLGSTVELPRSEETERTAELTPLGGGETFRDTLPGTVQTFRPPANPGFLVIHEGGTRLVHAALSFGTLAEGDFTNTTTFDDLRSAPQNRRQAAIPAVPSEILLLAALFLLGGSWAHGQSRRTMSKEAVR